MKQFNFNKISIEPIQNETISSGAVPAIFGSTSELCSYQGFIINDSSQIL